MPGRLRIILLETDRQTVDEIRDAFEQGGIEIEVALSAETAIAVLSERHMDMVILSWAVDVEDMHGVLKTMRSVVNEMPIIVYNAPKAKTHQKKIQRGGATVVMPEPLRVPGLLAEVQSLAEPY